MPPRRCRQTGSSQLSPSPEYRYLPRERYHLVPVTSNILVYVPPIGPPAKMQRIGVVPNCRQQRAENPAEVVATHVWDEVTFLCAQPDGGRHHSPASIALLPDGGIARSVKDRDDFNTRGLGAEKVTVREAHDNSLANICKNL